MEIPRCLSCFKIASSAAIALPATPLLDRIVDKDRENLVTRDQHSMSDNQKLTSHLVAGNLMKIDLLDLPQATMLHTLVAANTPVPLHNIKQLNLNLDSSKRHGPIVSSIRLCQIIRETIIATSLLTIAILKASSLLTRDHKPQDQAGKPRVRSSSNIQHSPTIRITGIALYLISLTNQLLKMSLKLKNHPKVLLNPSFNGTHGTQWFKIRSIIHSIRIIIMLKTNTKINLPIKRNTRTKRKRVIARLTKLTISILSDLDNSNSTMTLTLTISMALMSRQ